MELQVSEIPFDFDVSMKGTPVPLAGLGLIKHIRKETGEEDKFEDLANILIKSLIICHTDSESEYDLDMDDFTTVRKLVFENESLFREIKDYFERDIP